MNKLQELWNKLPKEVKVAFYVAVSGALAALVDYLKVVELDNAIVMAIINVLIVLLKERNQIVLKRFKK